MTFSKRLPVTAVLAFAAALSGCLEKGDTNVEALQDAALGADPTCANVCGLITASEDAWNGCGVFAVKDRETCMNRCKEVNAGVTVWRCVMKQHNCEEVMNNCDTAF